VLIIIYRTLEKWKNLPKKRIKGQKYYFKKKQQQQIDTK
jgi:hypothetical protein